MINYFLTFRMKHRIMSAMFFGIILFYVPFVVSAQNFTIRVTNAAGSDAKAFSITIDQTTSISDHSQSQVNLFPNPVNDELKITNYEGGEVIILDVMGRCVAAVETGRAPSLQSTPETTINVSHLPPGMYFIKIGNKTAKFVKQ
jgi:hypothetical protein